MRLFIEEDRRYRLLVIAFCVATLIVGITAAVKYDNYFLLGNYAEQDNDDVRYIHGARVLVEQGKLAYFEDEPTTFVMPGYPLFLAAVLKVFGAADSDLVYVRAAQVIIQALSVYLLYFVGRELFNKRVGLLACFISFLYLPDYVASSLILTETLYRFFFILLFYFSILALKSRKTKYYIITGVVWGVVCLIRANAATYPLLLFIFWLVDRYTVREILKYGLIVSVAFFVLMSPWWIRNYNVSGRFIPFTDSSANPRLLGMFIFWQAPSFAKEIPEELMYDEFVRTVFSAREGVPEEVQHRLANYIFITGLKKEPVKYILWHTVGKTAKLYIAPYYWKPIFGVDKVTMGVFHLFIVIAGILGFITIKRRRSKGGAVLFVLLLITTVTFLPFITFDRYGYPQMYMFILAAAYYLESMYSKRPTATGEIT
ncbi:MAG: glycosyltransferase family 39 protein [Firmicutes bacterium]|nr:glycosyltransferase family 39 protein [Bacillota bacterium]